MAAAALLFSVSCAAHQAAASAHQGVAAEPQNRGCGALALLTAEPPVQFEVGDLNRKALTLPRPTYPKAARRAGIRGTVTVRVVIDAASGQVLWARVLSGPAPLYDAVLDAVCGVRFSATNDIDAKVGGTLRYRFGSR